MCLASIFVTISIFELMYKLSINLFKHNKASPETPRELHIYHQSLPVSRIGVLEHVESGRGPS